MSADIIPLPGARPPSQPIAHYLRIGETGHRQLETMFAEGHFPPSRVVVDASRFNHQSGLIKALKANSVEIVLDTKAAELSALGKYGGYSARTPWASAADGGPLGPEHFKADGPGDVISSIARFAVENGFHAVLAPCHLLTLGHSDGWFDVDRDACIALRKALDREGGQHIDVDFSLLIRHTQLRDEAVRGALLSGLTDLPFQSLWVRAAGFGADGSPSGARHFINALSSLHNLGKPIIADYLGGLIGAATVAFGAASGIAHGLGERERFDPSDWNKAARPKDEDGRAGGGGIVRITIHGLDKALSLPELKALANTRGGHRLCVCPDRSCCPHGLPDMLKNPKRHSLKQAFSRIAALERVPDLNRAQDFLDRDLTLVDRQTRQIKDLKPQESELKVRAGETPSAARDKFIERLGQQSLHTEKMRSVLESLHETRGRNVPRAPAVGFRGQSRKNLSQRSE